MNTGKTLLVIGVLVAGTITYNRVTDWNDARVSANETAERRAELAQGKAAIIQSAKAAVSAGDNDTAEKLLSPYAALADTDIAAAVRSNELDRLRRQIIEAQPGPLRNGWITSFQSRSPTVDETGPDLTRVIQANNDRVKRVDALANGGLGYLCSKLRQSPGNSEVLEAFERLGGRNEDIGAILSRNLKIGMPEFEVVCAWGQPEQVNRTVTARHEHKQLVYGSRHYAYTDDGILTSVQD